MTTTASPALSTTELSLRWCGLPTVGTLRKWRVQGRGPNFEVRADGERRTIVYPLCEVQRFELEHSSVPRAVAWRGRFLSLEELVARWKDTPLEVSAWKLSYWRKARGRGKGPPYVCVHMRQPLFPIEALEAWEKERRWKLGLSNPPSAAP